MTQLTRYARTCLHESGHAVAALRLGFHVDLVSVRETEYIRGLALVDPPSIDAGVEGAVVLLAGVEAVGLLDLGMPGPRIDQPRPSGPPRDVAASGIPPGLIGLDEERAALATDDLEWARILAQTALAVDWLAVVALAEALGRSGSLEGAEIRALLDPLAETPLPEPWRPRLAA